MTGSAKQSMDGALKLDCFVAEFIIGPAEGGTRWLLAMTTSADVSSAQSLYYITNSEKPPGSDSASVFSVQLLDRHRDALPDADAHRRQRPTAAALLHAVHRGHRQPRPAHAQGVTERDGAAMRVDEIGVLLDAELAQAGDALRGEGFVELDQIEIADLQSQPLHQLARRRHRTDAHDTRRHRRRGEAKNFRPRRQPVPLHRRFRRKNHRGGAVIDSG